MTTSTHRVPATGLPWVEHRRRSVIRDTAAPLLVGALRRVLTIPARDKLMVDLANLDKGRATKQRVASAVSWNRVHPVLSRPFVHYLPHAGYVLRAVGLTPSVVYATAAAFGVGPDDDDAALMKVAHLSVASRISVRFASKLHREHGWSAEDLIAWSEAYDEARLLRAVKCGYGYAELGEMVRSGQMPDEATLAFTEATRAPVTAA